MAAIDISPELPAPLKRTVLSMLSTQEQTFSLARQLTVRAAAGDARTRRELADIMESLAGQYGEVSEVAAAVSRASEAS